MAGGQGGRATRRGSCGVAGTLIKTRKTVLWVAGEEYVLGRQGRKEGRR